MLQVSRRGGNILFDICGQIIITVLDIIRNKISAIKNKCKELGFKY